MSILSDILTGLCQAMKKFEYGVDCKTKGIDGREGIFEFKFKDKYGKEHYMLSVPHTHWNFTDKKEYFAVKPEDVYVL